jgi:ABC-type antimicrobial peptide transport system permease subunit
VIGVVTSVRQSLLAARGGFVYVPVETPDRPDIEFFLAAPAAPEGDVARAVAAAVVALAPSAHVEVDAVTFADVYLREVGEAQFHGPVVVALGAAALLLAGLGLFGVITYLSEQRHREVGIRVALGAGPSDVWAAVLRESVIPAGVGLAFGLAAAIWVNQALRSLVRGLQVADAVPMLIVTAVILVTAVIACVRPARRALRVDPVSVLRSE